MISEGLNRKNISICVGWDDSEGRIQYLSDYSEGLEHTMEILSDNEPEVSFAITYTGQKIKGCKAIKEIYTIDQNGVHIHSQLVEPIIDKIYYIVPLYCSNGKDIGDIVNVQKKCVFVQTGNYIYSVNTSGNITIDNARYANRNGEYCLASIEGENREILINLNLSK